MRYFSSLCSEILNDNNNCLVMVISNKDENKMKNMKLPSHPSEAQV